MSTRKESANNLGEMIRFYLACSNKPLRTVADEIGVSAATLMRISHGREPDSATMLKLWQWMFSPPQQGDKEK